MGFSDADMMGRGGKTGSGRQMSESQENQARRERLRKLALETVDLNKDPYFMRNHLGTYECKLCLTIMSASENPMVAAAGRGGAACSYHPRAALLWRPPPSLHPPTRRTG